MLYIANEGRASIDGHLLFQRKGRREGRTAAGGARSVELLLHFRLHLPNLLRLLLDLLYAFVDALQILKCLLLAGYSNVMADKAKWLRCRSGNSDKCRSESMPPRRHKAFWVRLTSPSDMATLPSCVDALSSSPSSERSSSPFAAMTLSETHTRYTAHSVKLNVAKAIAQAASVQNNK